MPLRSCATACGRWSRCGSASTRPPAIPVAQRGFALLAVLWGVALLAVIAAGLTAATRSDARLASNIAERMQAEALAEAGIFAAILELHRAGDAPTWPADGQLLRLSLDGGRAEVTGTDEAGKVDLNAAPEELVAGLLRAVGLPDQEAARLADAIADFRDEDGLRRLNGAEDAEYRAAGLSHGAFDRPFQTVEELRFVLGADDALVARVAPFVTVYTRESGIDPEVAPATALLALPGIDAAAVTAALDAVDGRAERLALALREVDDRLLGATAGRLFTLRAAGTTDGGTAAVREAVIRLTGNPHHPYVIHAWRQPPASLNRMRE